MTTESVIEVEHGISGGFYDNMARLAFGSGGQRLICLCGSNTSGTGNTWEEAGAELDAHLKENKIL